MSVLADLDSAIEDAMIIREEARPHDGLAAGLVAALERIRDALSTEDTAANAMIPVMIRGGKVLSPSKYRVHSLYESFDEAAAVVDQLRRDPDIAWAYIPDEYAPALSSEDATRPTGDGQ